MDAGEQTNNRQDETTRARLWCFALDVYGKPGVATACLSAQQRWGIDVNLMLYACWCAGQGVLLATGDWRRAEAHCRAWRDGVVLPVRRQREAWHNVTECRAEYAAIKDLELQAERRQLEFLADLFEGEHGAGPGGESEARTHADLLTEQLKGLARHYRLEDDAFAAFSAALQQS